ncbi:unnamed protein product [Trifolium pratense]|uniref:Uncharacterized protein n=1 Tax=Trifolium pratense TaxID=57577 RepID=A0ACB0K4J5_TRIPR|nr:unnamed protein product [Trifolium pratense]
MRHDFIKCTDNKRTNSDAMLVLKSRYMISQIELIPILVPKINLLSVVRTEDAMTTCL